MLCEVIGWLGALCVLWAYYLISTGKVTGESLFFQWINFIGASLLIVYTLYKSAYPSAFVNIAWLLIAIVGLWKLYRKK
ncbi:MAG TPA: hypothetical protein DCR46_04325 [Cytophagales bacterium]|nr:hypothetical protein [Cytophagales bacterium]